MSFDELSHFDQAYQESLDGMICGIDEAGRGPLAGPVFAACVVLKPDAVLEGLNDSKKLTEKKREKIYDHILNGYVAWYGIGAASAQEIDEINILQATFLAMRRAYHAMLEQVETVPVVALVDGNADPGLPIETVTVVKGDAKSASIAAASILAKVTRDRYMLHLHEQYPEYAFDKHKGYPTKLHYEAIQEFGISPVHRLSFLKKITGEK